MSSRSRPVLAAAVMVPGDVRSLDMRSLRGVGIRGRQVGELARGGPGGLVDAIADDGSANAAGVASVLVVYPHRDRLAGRQPRVAVRRGQLEAGNRQRP